MAAHDELVAALAGALDECDRTGSNLPEMLRAALESVAREHGGSWALVRHRPGSWEASHVVALASGADW